MSPLVDNGCDINPDSQDRPGIGVNVNCERELDVAIVDLVHFGAANDGYDVIDAGVRHVHREAGESHVAQTVQQFLAVIRFHCYKKRESLFAAQDATNYVRT